MPMIGGSSSTGDDDFIVLCVFIVRFVTLRRATLTIGVISHRPMLDRPCNVQTVDTRKKFANGVAILLYISIPCLFSTSYPTTPRSA
ncbi:hypothetical protein F4813DRAFT_368003 [Daldinia decipiens]|uniref:uncharacterized protein n=1 Tax=Daldinia decipiens TaxID=326647 RepID=UPI0020C39C37|nr:uncharacterized protein F4813DRAFT_368003 [Daldinia decipiens]KAI1655182.1 hypothetical protein F4813DRAFT_368003 [Daldinia decipiens]